MDNMEFTKITGAVCGALLFFLMINWGAETLYHVESGDSGHGDSHSETHHYHQRLFITLWWKQKL